MIDNGKVRVISVSTTSAGAGATTVALRPPENKQWTILYAVAYHADAAGVVCDWVFQDPDSGGNVGLSGGGITINPAVMQPLGGVISGGNSNFLGPVKATYTRYPSFVFVASAVNKVGYVRAVVLEYTGLLDG